MKQLTYATLLTGAMCAAAAVAGDQAKDTQHKGHTQATTQQSMKQSPSNQQSMTTAQAGDSQQAGTGQKQAADQMSNQRPLLVVGEVIDTRDVKLKGVEADHHRLLKVRTSEGKQVVVDIGVPRGEIAQVDFEKGDRIVAVGKAARINERPVLFAQTVGEVHSAGVASNQPRDTQSAQGEQQGQGKEIRRAAADEPAEESEPAKD